MKQRPGISNKSPAPPTAAGQTESNGFWIFSKPLFAVEPSVVHNTLVRPTTPLKIPATAEDTKIIKAAKFGNSSIS